MQGPGGKRPTAAHWPRRYSPGCAQRAHSHLRGHAALPPAGLKRDAPATQLQQLGGGFRPACTGEGMYWE